MGSIIGFIAGWLLTRSIIGGFIGSFIGGALIGDAKLFRNAASSGNFSYGHRPNYYRKQINQNDFATALLVLSAAVMKADGKVLKSELDYVKQFLKQQFPPEFVAKQVKNFRDILDKDFDLKQVCGDIQMVMNYQQRTVLIQYLFGVANADGNVAQSELDVIQRVAKLLRG